MTAAPPHLAPLERYRLEIADGGRTIPRFDPRDGGAAARLLILLETPGPAPAPIAMISRDNRGGTARNLRRFLDEADLARRDTLLWNVVPWIVHAPGARNRPLRRTELAEGVALVPRLLDCLPLLRAIVLAGRSAAAAEAAVRAARPALPVLLMPHPSPTYVCTSPGVTERIVAALAAARCLLGPA